MRLSLLIFGALLFLGGCKKIPERSAVELQLISINGTEMPQLNELQELTISYDSETELSFSFTCEAGVKEFYAKLVQSIYDDIEGSDTERISNEPQPGDQDGKFTYTVTPSDQFEPPVGNPVVDRKLLQLILIDELGTVHEAIYTINLQ